MRLDLPTAILAMIVTAVIFTSAALTVWPTGAVEVDREFTVDQEKWMLCYQLFDYWLDTEEDSPRYIDARIQLDIEECWP